ncbi:MAG: hypothetical protein KDA68_21150, partial [Planctomycetaceae bacterium]|nr:hypothetical protein [Planctomycetaceae bacterium]
MLLRNWLSNWKLNRIQSRSANARLNRSRSLGHPQSLEIRTLLTSITFTIQTGAANPLNGVDLGTSAAPTLGNLDGDGDLDLIAGKNDGTLAYYKNTGTATAPAFTEQTG